jgi:hypothetical protein
MGKEVHCVRFYEDVIDEVCERDFYPGVPMSGRLLAGVGNWGAPYIKPFGNPEKWASIPSEHVADFSWLCLENAVALFETIEQLSGRSVHIEDLDRRIVGLPESGEYTAQLRAIVR